MAHLKCLLSSLHASGLNNVPMYRISNGRSKINLFSVKQYININIAHESIKMVTISINLPSCSPFVSYDDVSASSVVHGDYKKSTNYIEEEDVTFNKERSEVEESRDGDDDLYIATAISMGTDCKTKTLRESLVYDNKEDANEKVLSLQKGDTKSLSQSSRSSIKRDAIKLKSKSSINESSPSESIVDKTTRNVSDDCSSMLDGSVNNVTPKKVNHVFELCESCKFGKIYMICSPDLYLTSHEHRQDIGSNQGHDYLSQAS